ncbi:acyl-CoA carboxylase subunit epsilon [Corynebacterium sputi]|uniref:acyl-CoA carboxylase subunit epsilon n=1 Tax=Corynebacterium sputi TaxID=489915 RepID=UPI0004095D0E|nr:acyl-CoA carboxylase subunit epsilon [Corynebacterium sputi]
MTDKTDSTDSSTDAAEAKPFLTVINGSPTPEETAALATLFASMASAAEAAAKGPRNEWGRFEDKFQNTSSFNPSSFQNVRYY